MKSLKRLSLLLLLLIGYAGCNESSLSIQAKIIYNMGGPQPVARTRFYLLDVDPFTLRVDDPSYRERMSQKSKEEQDAAFFGAAAFFLFKLAIENNKITPENAKQLLGSIEPGRSLWEPHLVREVTTDFDGGAKMDGLTPGKYWLLGLAETRAAFSLWNLPVQITRGENTLLLDQNNALYSK